MSIANSEGRINQAETTHNPEKKDDSWPELNVSLQGRNRLHRVGQELSDTLDRAIEANPELFPDPEEYPDEEASQISPYMPQGGKFHQFDIVSHMSTSEEVFRNGKALEGVRDVVNLDELKQYYAGSLNNEVTQFDNMNVVMRLHDAGKLFEDRRPFDPEKPYVKQEKGEKQKLQGSPYIEEDHFDIGQEIIADMEGKGILKPDEAQQVAESLQAHSVIQKKVYTLWKENRDLGELVQEIEDDFTPEQVLNGTVAVLADEFAKGTPPDAAPDSNFYKDQAALEQVAPVLINGALSKLKA